MSLPLDYIQPFSFESCKNYNIKSPSSYYEELTNGEVEVDSDKGESSLLIQKTLLVQNKAPISLVLSADNALNNK